MDKLLEDSLVVACEGEQLEVPIIAYPKRAELKFEPLCDFGQVDMPPSARCDAPY